MPKTPYTPPAESLTVVKGISFAEAEEFLPDIKKDFDAFDEKVKRHKIDDDPNHCVALLRFAKNDRRPKTVFWESKMAIDADGGPNVAHLTGLSLDPEEGSASTAFEFSEGEYLVAEENAYVVLSEWKDFIAKEDGGRTLCEVRVGDVAVVVYKGLKAAAIVGDTGPEDEKEKPQAKIGEGSIKLHKLLGRRDACKMDHTNTYCVAVGKESIPGQVLFFVFPGSGALLPVKALARQNIEARVATLAFDLFARLSGGA
jgi:hypothetical protein